MADVIYDRIGAGYALHRRGDPRLAARIEAALGDARSVLNVGAGAGSYEPAGREVTAVEPSVEMISQRPPGAAPVVRASAESLPFADGSFDVAMAILTAHHWADLDAGLAEMRRVARRRLVILTFDPEPLEELWINADYFPETLKLRRPAGAGGGDLAARLPAATVAPVPVPRDCEDRFFAALWGRPELLFDDEVMRPLWIWRSIPEQARRAGRARLRSELDDGTWQRRHGHLLEREEFDVGLRLVVSELGPGPGEA